MGKEKSKNPKDPKLVKNRASKRFTNNNNNKGDTKLSCMHSEELCYLEEINDDKAEKRKLKKERQKEKRIVRKRKLEKENAELAPSSWLETEDKLSPLSQSKITLTKCPFTTLKYFLLEILCAILDTKERFFSHVFPSLYEKNACAPKAYLKLWLAMILEFFIISFSAALVGTGTYFWTVIDDPVLIQMKQRISWYAYWAFLGILSSVGLGTGLHTFVLYLGPFIAKVTLAAQECSSVDFPQPPFPDQISCPNASHVGEPVSVTVLDIMAKVRWECLSWGFGTALGELPPYFMARAARLNKRESGLLDGQGESRETLMERAKLWVKSFVKKVGFWGILICASIPNPLFDLAGITCGHFLVPFMAFFGATLIGKTIVKSQLQMIFVILAFKDTSLKRVLKVIESFPKIGLYLRNHVADLVDNQRATFSNNNVNESTGILPFILEKFVLCLIICFLISIVNGLAQNYHERISKRKEFRERNKCGKKRRSGQKLRANT